MTIWEERKERLARKRTEAEQKARDNLIERLQQQVVDPPPEDPFTVLYQDGLRR